VFTLTEEVRARMGAAERRFCEEEFTLFDEITKISALLRPLPRDARKQRLREELSRIKVCPGAYLPTNPSALLVRIVPQLARPLQSASRVPILVAFETRRGQVALPDYQAIDAQQEEKGQRDIGSASGGGTGIGAPESKAPRTDQRQQQPQPLSKVQACIFKVGDDTRQDALALQVMSACRDIWRHEGLPLFVYPYRVLPNRILGLIGGVIECIADAETRDEIGKATGCSLKEYFVRRWGKEHTTAFREAQRRFIQSCAGYAVVSYLLQVKDRHNGNLMIDKHGHLIHIDFGFVFDTSPANDLKFEKAAFKLTLEMFELMGGSAASPLYRWFVELVLRGFLAVRRRVDDLCQLVQPMLASSLSCFKPASLDKFRARFLIDRDERVRRSALPACHLLTLDCVLFSRGGLRDNAGRNRLRA